MIDTGSGRGIRTNLGKTIPSVAFIAFFLVSGIQAGPGPVRTQNPGEPLYCQPNETATFLIVDGTTGIFTTAGDCYTGSDVANNNIVTAPTQGTFASDGAGDYVYTTTNPAYTGLDTFQVHVDQSSNPVSGGPGAFGGTPGTVTVTLNVLPSSLGPFTTTANTPVQIPVPPGSVSPCPATFGCVSGAKAGSVAPTLGTLSFAGLNVTYTPRNGSSGTDNFTIQALGADNDGNTALNSGNIQVQVVISSPGPVPTPALSTWGMLAAAGGLVAIGSRAIRRNSGVNRTNIPGNLPA
jgi:hypothetical protein